MGDSIAGIRQDNGQGIVIAEWKLAETQHIEKITAS